MRATALGFLMAVAALAQLVAGPLRLANPCPGSGTDPDGCCCAAPETTPASGCCGDEHEDEPEAPHRACDCHVDPAPSAPPDAPPTLPEAVAFDFTVPRATAIPVPPPAPVRPVLGVCRPPGPPGPARHVALCVFLI